MTEDDIKRPRISQEADEYAAEKAEQYGISKREYIQQAIFKDDESVKLAEIAERQKKIAAALGIDEEVDVSDVDVVDITEGVVFNSDDSKSEVEDDSEMRVSHVPSLNDDVDVNDLRAHHDVALDPESRDWSEVTKQSVDSRLGIVWGFINEAVGDDQMGVLPIPIVERCFDPLGLSDRSVSRYIYERAPDRDVWYPSITRCRSFDERELYRAIIEERASSESQARELRETYDSLEDMLDTDVMLDGEKHASPELNRSNVVYTDAETCEELTRQKIQRLRKAIQKRPKAARRYAMSYLMQVAVTEGYVAEEWAEEMRASVNFELPSWE